MTTVTYEDLTEATDVEDTDLLASWRATGPLKSLTALRMKTYIGGAALPLAGGTMTGAILGSVGTVSLPGYAFAGDPDTGLYRIGANNLGIAIGGTKIVDVAASGMTLTGTLTATAFAGPINGAIGGSTPAAGSFTTVTATSLVLTPATAVGGAGFRLPHGTAPSAPTNGDMWSTTAGFYGRVNGQTVGPFGAGGSTGSANTWSLLQTMSGGFLNGANGQVASYALVTADSGKLVYIGGGAGKTLTLPSGLAAGHFAKILNVTGSTLAIAGDGGSSLQFMDSLSSPIAASTSCWVFNGGSDIWYVMR